MKNIFETLEKNKFDYNEILEKSNVNIINNEIVDINVIVGFRGRLEFLNPLIDSFNNAFKYYNSKYSNKKFCLTFVEHSEKSESEELLKNRVNYLWTPGNVSEQYSRSFSYNFGVKFSTDAKYYLLHDIDILVKENFFEEIYGNLKDETKCLQTYGKRRVLYMSDNLTKKVIKKEIEINEFSEETEEVTPPTYHGVIALGSKGGSILVEKEFYYKIGGFDPELFFGYAAEDQMFWDKALTYLGKIDYADNPPIDMFHMWHPPTHSTNPYLHEMESYMLQFRGFNKKGRMQVLENQRNNLK